MLIVVLADAAAVAVRAADMVADVVTRNERPVLGLAAGATPLGLYAELVRRHAGGLDFSPVSVFGLDEYLGLPAEHPSSCAWTLRRHLIDRVNLDPARVRLLEGRAAGDWLDHGAAFERAIAAAGGVDLQILGLGLNGHIGFNEPGCSLAGRTRRVALSAATRASNRTSFSDGDVPATAVTMGIGTILEARRLLLLATGASKAGMVAKAVEGPVTAMVPASALQLHPDAVMMLDEAAAAGLQRRADYDAEAELA